MGFAAAQAILSLLFFDEPLPLFFQIVDGIILIIAVVLVRKNPTREFGMWFISGFILSSLIWIGSFTDLMSLDTFKEEEQKPTTKQETLSPPPENEIGKLTEPEEKDPPFVYQDETGNIWLQADKFIKQQLTENAGETDICSNNTPLQYSSPSLSKGSEFLLVSVLCEGETSEIFIRHIPTATSKKVANGTAGEFISINEELWIRIDNEKNFSNPFQFILFQENKITFEDFSSHGQNVSTEGVSEFLQSVESEINEKYAISIAKNIHDQDQYSDPSKLYCNEIIAYQNTSYDVFVCTQGAMGADDNFIYVFNRLTKKLERNVLIATYLEHKTENNGATLLLFYEGDEHRKPFHMKIGASIELRSEGGMY